MPDTELPAKLIAQQDQENAAHEQFARNMAIYYKSLIDNGIPVDLAEYLIKEASRFVYARITGGSYYPPSIDKD